MATARNSHLYFFHVSRKADNCTKISTIYAEQYKIFAKRAIIEKEMEVSINLPSLHKTPYKNCNN